MPAEGLEPGRDVFAEGDIGAGRQRDVVLVVEVNQFAEFQVSSDRGRFEGDAFHHVTVGDDAVGEVIDDVVARPVEGFGQEALGHGQANAVRKALPQRSGCDFNAWGVATFWVSRGTRTQLPECLQIVDAEVVACEVQQRVDQGGPVTGGEDKPVAIAPLGVARIVLEEILPEHVGHRRRAHRQARVPGIGCLDSIDRQGADRIDGERFERGVGSSGDGHERLLGESESNGRISAFVIWPDDLNRTLETGSDTSSYRPACMSPLSHAGSTQ